MEEKYIKAGKIAAQALEFGAALIKPGALAKEICDKTDEKIRELGGEPAFPAQIALNDTAAHFCPDEEDETILKDELVSIDVGVHVDGFIGDNARTIDLSGKNQELVKASREALMNAIAFIKPGVTFGEIGKVIHDTITKYGFSPVRNLSGHGLDEYDVHTKPTVPNYDNGDETKVEEGMVFAIEPFASAGAGIIYESSNGTIFQLYDKKPTRNMITRQIIKEIETYHALPFCSRWLQKKFGIGKTRMALKEMKMLGMIKEYPPLIDQNHGLVSQAEHTVIIRKDKAEILTTI